MKQEKLKISTAHHTFVIEKSYSAKPEKVFAAFQDPKKKRRWFAEGEGFEVASFEMDFRVGGTERTVFSASEGSPIAGCLMSNDSTFMDIVENQRIVLSYTMTIGDHRISSSLATFEMIPANSETRLIFTEQVAFFEGADGVEMRKAGWMELLNQLGRTLEQT